MRSNSYGSNVGTSSKSSLSAVGYVRVSTDMQANDGLSLDAQKQAIRDYCSSCGLKLLKIYEDVESGGKADRPGLADALATDADVFVVLKFDRLSRSIRHFCELYEQHFAKGRGKHKELIAIREAIRLDSALGRALVSILLVFAQMEREATGERTREAISYIRRSGYHFGKIPYGHKAVPAPDNPRYKILVEDADEQAVLSRIKAMLDSGMGLTEVAAKLAEDGVPPPQGSAWTRNLIFNLKLRKGWHVSRGVNKRSHTDEEVKLYIYQLRDRGLTYQGIANILNEQGYKPYKGKRFTQSSVFWLLGNVKELKVLTPKEFCQALIARAGEPKPSLQHLARALGHAGYLTPRGNTHWWPAQVQQLLKGTYDTHYPGIKPTLPGSLSPD